MVFSVDTVLVIVFVICFVIVISLVVIEYTYFLLLNT
jgi:hypothetical protein